MCVSCISEGISHECALYYYLQRANTHTTKSTDRPNWPTEVHTESHWPQNNAFNLSLIGYSFDVYASPFGAFRTARNVSNTILSPIYRTMFSNKMRLYFVIGYIHWWWNMFIEWNSQHTAPIELGQFSILIFVVKVRNVHCPRCVCQFDTRQIFYRMKANILWCVCVCVWGSLCIAYMHVAKVFDCEWMTSIMLLKLMENLVASTARFTIKEWMHACMRIRMASTH